MRLKAARTYQYGDQSAVLCVNKGEFDLSRLWILISKLFVLTN